MWCRSIDILESLDESIADRRRLGRSGEDGQAAGIGRERAERAVADAAPVGMDDIDVVARERGRLAHHPGVGDSETIEDAPDELRARGRDPLAGCLTRLLASRRPTMTSP